MSDKHDWREALKAVIDERRQALGEHPEAEELVAYYAGEMGEKAAQRLRDHLVLCPHCAKLLLDLDSFASQAAQADFPAVEDQPSPPPPSSEAEGAPRLGTWRRHWWTLPLAAAAALLLLILAWPQVEPLPPYSLELSGDLLPTRSDGNVAGQVPLFGPGSHLSLRLLPETALREPPQARAYLLHQDKLRALSGSTIEVRRDGVVSIEGTVGSDFYLPAGRSRLIVAVARPGALPSRSQVRAAQPSSGPQWAIFQADMQFSETSAPPGPPSASEPRVEFSGCRSVLQGPVCLLNDERRLTLWVRHDDASAVRIYAGTWRHSYSGVEAEQGLRYQIQVGSTEEVVVEVLTQERRLIWMLAVSDQAPSRELGRADSLFRSGQWEEAVPLLQNIAASATHEQASALSLLARIEGSRGSRQLSERHYRQAMSGHAKSGRMSDRIKDSAALVHQLIGQRRLADARRLLEKGDRGDAGLSADSRYFLAYSRGLLAEEAGDLRSARRWMLQAAQAAERAGLVQQRLFAEDILARQLGTAGLLQDAEAVYSRIQPVLSEDCSGHDKHRLLTACDCARFAVNRAWVRLLAGEAGDEPDAPPPMDLLKGAEYVFERQAESGANCLRPENLPNVRLNQALAALQSGRPEEAREHLQAAAIDAEQYPRLALWQLDVQARLAVADGLPGKALALYRELAQRASLAYSPEAAWRAAFGSAISHSLMGENAQAIDYCHEAEHLLEAESSLVPVDQGRELFLGQRRKAARFCLGLLLRDGRTREALESARRSAARGLRSLRAASTLALLSEQERTEREELLSRYRASRAQMEAMAVRIWEGLPRDDEERLREQLAIEQGRIRQALDGLASLAEKGVPGNRALPPLPDDALLLIFHPLEEGWAALAADRTGLQAEIIGQLPDTADEQEVSRRLLEPFSRSIRDASQVRIIPYGPLRDVDFHALPFGDGILLQQATVIYHFDLGTPAPAPSGEGALVVSGPGLQRAWQEAEVVKTALDSRAAPEAADWLRAERADSAAVRKRLAQVDLFHYAGHAHFDDRSRGWDSHLSLTAGGRLTIDDILALPRVPRWVVLSGCETGRDSRSGPLPSIGLAQAFLVAGSRTVVAATSEVSDDDAALLSEAFYRRWTPATPMGVALQEAQLEVRRRAPQSDWREFRVLAR